MKFEDKKILAIKIPKCGTNSLNIILKNHDKYWKRAYYYGHDPLFLLDKNNILNKNTFIFCIVRNPYLRFFSQFNECLRLGFKYETLTSFVGDIKIKKLHPLITSPQVEFVSIEKHNNLIIPEKINYNDIKNYGQYEYFDKTPIIHPKLNKIYKLEKIFELENDLNIIMPTSRFSQYLTKDYKNLFDEHTISFIQKYYINDFLTFDYSLKFDDSLKYLKKEKKIIFKYH